MLYGVVTSRRETTLPLAISNSKGKPELIDTIIDTGFSGLLSLLSATIATLELPWSASNIATLGDGSETLFDLCTVTVIWDGQYREIYVAESETEPLIGMALLYGYQLQINAVGGGSVQVRSLQS
ncbi:MAG: clan AA aspartic protease [Cyanobacteria bacterium J06627_28]